MKNVLDKIIYNKFFIFILFLVFLKPYFLSFNDTINLICNVFLILFSIVIYYSYFSKFHLSKIQKVLFLFLGASLISTIFVSHDISSWIKYFIKISSISLYTEVLVKKDLEVFLKTLSVLLYAMITVTFITTIIWPKGIFGFELLFLGYDNSTIVLLILGAMFVLFSCLYFYIKQKNNKFLLIGIIPFIMTVCIYLITWSVGALIGCIIIIIFLVAYLIMKKYKIDSYLYKYLNLKYLFWICLFLFLGVVVFGIQKYFSFIIVDIFHKDLTITNRTYIWESCFVMIKKFPIFGTGILNFDIRLATQGIYHAHSNFLNVILESGFLGFILYLLLWLTVIKSINSSSNNILKLIVSVSLFSFLVMTTIDVIDNSELVYVFLVLGFYLPYISNKFKSSNNSKQNILILIDSGLPIPAVNGGAVETLVDSIIKTNEKNKKYNIDVYSSYAKEVKTLKNKSKNVRYKYVNEKSISYFLLKCIRYTYRKLFKKEFLNIFSLFVLDDLEPQQKFDYYDYVIVENSPLMILNLKKKMKSKFILHVHNDIDNLKYDDKCLDYYNKIICCSNYVSKRVESITNTSVVTVYNGVDVKSLLKYNNNLSKNKLRKKYKIPTNAIVFGYCGRLCEDKGTKELIVAFKEVCKNNKNAYLVLTGNSFFKNSNITPYIGTLIECSKGFEDKIIFTGYFDHSEIGKFYSMIDIYVQPSIVNEACPLTIIESQVMSKILLTTNSGGIPELVKNKNTFIITRENLVKDLFDNMKDILINYNDLKNKKRSKEVLKIFDENMFAMLFLNEIN